jgi:hypothetical protein
LRCLLGVRCLTPLLHFVAEEQEQALIREYHLRPVCVSVLQAPGHAIPLVLVAEVRDFPW